MPSEIIPMTESPAARRRAPRASAGTVYRRWDADAEEYRPTWWLNYIAPGGRRVRESAGTTVKAEAVAKLRSRMGEVSSGRFVGPEGERVTFEDLMDGVEQAYRLAGKRSGGRVKKARAHLARHFGGARAVSITAARLTAYADARTTADKAAPSTVRYELAILRRAFTLAVKQGRLATRPAFPTVAVDNVRTGFFEADEFKAVVKELPEPLRNVARFAHHTGWRSGEIRGLRWSDLDWTAKTVRLEGTASKNAEGRTFPFGALPALLAVMESQRAYTEAVQKRTGQIVPWLFHREGKPIRSMDTAWRSACKRAKVPGRLMHDFRRTAVRNLERAGVPRSVAMKLTGHKTEAIYRRYAIVSERDLADGVAKLAALATPPVGPTVLAFPAVAMG